MVALLLSPHAVQPIYVTPAGISDSFLCCPYLGECGDKGVLEVKLKAIVTVLLQSEALVDKFTQYVLLPVH